MSGQEGNERRGSNPQALPPDPGFPRRKCGMDLVDAMTSIGMQELFLEPPMLRDKVGVFASSVAARRERLCD
jgi:hypothetical protein